VFGKPADTDACASAALRGHLPVLQWARANDCPWDEMTCASAGTWAFCSGCMRMAARGTGGRAVMQPKAGT
jgi:hypothetical protein